MQKQAKMQSYKKEYATFGPGGNSESFYAAGHKATVEAPGWLEEIGLDAYEYQGGRGINASEASLAAVGKKAAEHGILMSLHAPYFISLSGIVEETRLKSIGYIQKSLWAADLLGADTIVIHCGSLQKQSREAALDLSRDTLCRVIEEVGDTKVRLGIETMGKIGQLGTLEEVIELCRISPKYAPVVDFGHLNARNLGGYFTDADSYRRVFDTIACKLGDEYADNLHCHFSQIEYTKSGEKQHLTFADTEFGPFSEPLMEAIAREGVHPRIICESAGTMAEDALTMKGQYLKARGLV